MKKILSLAIAVTMIAMVPATAFAHCGGGGGRGYGGGRGGCYGNRTYATTQTHYTNCGVENCTAVGIHEHDGVNYCSYAGEGHTYCGSGCYNY